MCGIIARVGGGDVLADVLGGLENLEYRGYDSAGVAVADDGSLRVEKREGEISELRERLAAAAPGGRVGIGHTRWSTHGPPTDANAHPHTDCRGRVAVVHNGIVENYGDLRAALRERGHAFASETDTEVVPHLVEDHLAAGTDPATAFRRAVGHLEGSYAVVMLHADREAVYATRRDSPLVVGVADDGCFLASDVPAFLEHTDRVTYLEDGDVVEVTRDGFRVTDAAGRPVERPVETVDWVAEDAEKSGYDHYMLKEIHEQPTALARAVSGRFDAATGRLDLDGFPPGAFDGVERVQLLGCGTSYHAALYGRHLLARRGVPAVAYRAGEYATDPAPADERTLAVAVTQSGETADTLASLRRAADAGARTLALTNVVGSTAARECDEALFIRAGPEIGVAATKTFSSQVATLAPLAERLARDVTGSGADDAPELFDALASLPDRVATVLDGSHATDVVDRHRDRDAYFFIGRGTAHPVATEGALKFKEITYEHAEGFAAGQLKHGPLALVTPDTPVFAVFTGRHDEKTRSNVEEVRSRGAPVVAVAPPGSGAASVADDLLAVPETHHEAAGLLANVQLQLVSYHVADLLGRPIDKPRNLAKSVTVV